MHLISRKHIQGGYIVNNKSRLAAFMLSVLPGLSHLYLGMTDRALTFFILFMGLCIGGVTVSFLLPGFYMLGPYIFIAMVIVWFVTLADAFALMNGEGTDEPGEYDSIDANRGFLALNNRKIIAISLSIIPGAGHMYLGLLKQGTQLMTVFFLVVFVTNWLHMSLLAFILPVLWFYSLFDAYHFLEEESNGVQTDESPLFEWFRSYPAWMGWGLIILSGLVILQRAVAPILETLLSASVRNNLETAFIALLLLAGGIKMLAGNKTAQKMEEDKYWDR